MIEFVGQNWLEIIIAIGVIGGWYKTGRKTKKFENNCFNTLKNEVKNLVENVNEIKTDMAGMETRIKDEIQKLNDKTYEQEGAIEFLKGKMNGAK